MKLHAGQRVGRIRSAGNWDWTQDNRGHDLPMFEKERPDEGLPTHLLKRRDVERFIELIPAWDELSEGLHWVVLSRETRCMGWHTPGVVALCAWEEQLWYRDVSKRWYWDHVDVLERLAVDVWKEGPRWVVGWTEDQARAFQLLHVFVHELGHHHDRITTRNQRRAARGESYAEQFALELADELWDDFLRVFPL